MQNAYNCKRTELINVDTPRNGLQKNTDRCPSIGKVRLTVTVDLLTHRYHALVFSAAF